MLGLDDETLILLLQIVNLVLVAIQFLPQIKLLHQKKEKVVKNLSLSSWLCKTAFSLFFVASLFAGDTNILIVATNLITLTMSMIVTVQIAMYSDLHLIPQPIQPFGMLGELEEVELIHVEDKHHEIPILHHILKQIYVFSNFNLMPKLL